MQIVNFFYELARQQLGIRSFHYGRNAAKGVGSELMPLIWLDDPVLFGGNSATGTGDYTVNLDIIDIPGDGKTVEWVQGACLAAGMALITKIQSLKQRKFVLSRWTGISLSEYTDNKAAGWRFTFTVTAPMPVNLCADYFDPDKQFPTVENLPDFATDNPEGCAVFNDKPGLPKFSIQ